MIKTLHVIFTNKDEWIEIDDEKIDIFARDITAYIIKYYQKNQIQHILAHQYDFLEKSEQMFIGGQANREIPVADVYNIVHKQLKPLLRECDALHIQGFVLFRLYEYIGLLEDAVESAVNGYIVDLEYNQLIEYLTMYVRMQTPLVDEINIFAYDGKYFVKDARGNEIFTLVDFEDTMLDIIITLAPERINIYDVEEFQNKQLVQTIIKIFQGRVHLFQTKPCQQEQESTNFTI